MAGCFPVDGACVRPGLPQRSAADHACGLRPCGHLTPVLLSFATGIVLLSTAMKGREPEEKQEATGLAPTRTDYIASASRSALGAVPIFGALLCEIADKVIPNQQMNRLVHFAAELEKRTAELEQANIRAQMSNENFTDLVEEGARQAARSTSDERREHIASLIANGLKPEAIEFVESKHLLRILGEINDMEVLVLRFYLHATVGGDEEFRAKHGETVRPIPVVMASPKSDLDKRTLQDSYRTHLVRLGLLRERVQMDSKTKMPVFDDNGFPKNRGFQITPLGRLLLEHIGLTEQLT